jgi:hypothetical protein
MRAVFPLFGSGPLVQEDDQQEANYANQVEDPADVIPRTTWRVIHEKEQPNEHREGP